MDTIDTLPQGDRSTDDDPERKAGFSPFTGAKTDDAWLRRGQEIAKRGTLDIIEKTEQEYMPLGEVAAHFERRLPWKKAGVTKKVWVESHSDIENCSVVHWNQCLKIYGLRDNWEPAKQRYLTRNTDWKPKHSSSPLFAQDLLDDFRDRDLEPKTPVKGPAKVKGTVWQQRFYLARDELKRVAGIHNYESTILQTLDHQVAMDPAIDPELLASNEDAERRMARADAIRMTGDKSESRQALERMQGDWQASLERFADVGIEARPISPDFLPSPAEMALKLRMLREYEDAARAEDQNETGTGQKANFSSADPEPTPYFNPTLGRGLSNLSNHLVAMIASNEPPDDIADVLNQTLGRCNGDEAMKTIILDRIRPEGAAPPSVDHGSGLVGWNSTHMILADEESWYFVDTIEPEKPDEPASAFTSGLANLKAKLDRWEHLATPPSPGTALVPYTPPAPAKTGKAKSPKTKQASPGEPPKRRGRPPKKKPEPEQSEGQEVGSDVLADEPRPDQRVP